MIPIVDSTVSSQLSPCDVPNVAPFYVEKGLAVFHASLTILTTLEEAVSPEVVVSTFAS